MTKSEALEELRKGLQEIMDDSFKWCESDSVETSRQAISINKKAHDLHVIAERLQKNSYKEG